jgi:glycosyltransferase involved in cell wall biosynthesis
MRILLVHNRYQQAGGEDFVARAESSLLSRMGHAVELWEENNDSITGLIAACQTAVHSVYSLDHARGMQKRIQHFRPDLVHIHNFFPRFSPSIHIACRRAGVPVVQTLHNYRLLCPAATLHGRGAFCEECLRKPIPWPAVVHGCYRRSRLASLAVAHMLGFHRLLGTWNRSVSQFIALSEFSRDKFIDGGLPAFKIAVKPNFVDPDPGLGEGNGSYALFVGRLVKEKGLGTLLAAWNRLRNGMRLKIVGDGPLASDVAQAAATNPTIEWLGACDQLQVRSAMAKATVLLFPSTWYEAFPLVIAEAFAAGLPVIASRIGSMAELIADQKTGLLFAPRDAAALACAVEWAFTHPDQIRAMRLSARAEYEQKYTAEANYARLMLIYEAALVNSPEPMNSAPQFEAIG